MSDDLIYQIALTLIPQIGPIQARILLQHFNPSEIFQAKAHHLEKLEGIGTMRANSIRAFNDFAAAEAEMNFLEKFGVTPLFIGTDRYPRRLLNCCDAPTLLYFKGSADLNVSRMVAVIGTRHNTDHGRQLTEKLIADLASHQVTVVSGLAYGIDAIAHKSALKCGLPTFGVLAHGLDSIYPSQHSSLAKEMIGAGGILTEFRSNTRPDRHNFPVRNRVVAGMCDATIVVETSVRGGSIITAELANGYNRDVFAIPGRPGDTKSLGCNALIRTNKAMLINDANDLITSMNWNEPRKNGAAAFPRQKEIFPDLTADERSILAIIRDKQPAHIDDIHQLCGLSSSATAAAILSLELQNVIVSLPGKLYRLD